MDDRTAGVVLFAAAGVQMILSSEYVGTMRVTGFGVAGFMVLCGALLLWNNYWR